MRCFIVGASSLLVLVEFWGGCTVACGSLLVSV